MAKRAMNNLTKGAALLSFSGLLAKLLSALYKIPLQNWTGDQGFYVYQQVYPLYGLALALSLNGIPLFLSSWIAELEDLSQEEELLQKSFKLLCLVFSPLALFFFFSSKSIASLMGDIKLAGAIRMIALYYFLLPLLSSVRGYFQGHINMYPTASSQVLEQFLRVLAIIALAYLFLDGHFSVYQMSEWAYLASFIAALVASGLLLFYFFRKKDVTTQPSQGYISYSGLARRMLFEGFLLSIFSSLLLLLQLLDSFTVLNQLQAFGLNAQDAMLEKAVYDRAQPIAQLGLVASTGLIYTVLPSLSHPRFKNRNQRFKREIYSLFKVCLVFSGAAAVGLMAIMPQLNRFLFNDGAQSRTLALYMFSVLLLSMVLYFQNVLYLMQRRKSLIQGLVVVLLLKLIFNAFFIRQLGIIGASLSTVLALLGLALYFLYSLRDFLEPKKLLTFLLKLVLPLVVMAIFVKIFLGLSDLLAQPTRWQTLPWIVLAVLLAALFYLILIRELRLLSIREWLYVPFTHYLRKDRKHGKN